MRRIVYTFFAALLTALPLLALEPHEMLSDPELEARAQALDAEIRCVVCESENVAGSRSAWASDARILIRELITEGQTDTEIKAFFQARYGDFVLMTPTRQGVNWLLWLSAPILAVLGLLSWFLYTRSRQPVTAQGSTLSDEEEEKLAKLLNDM